MLSTIVNHLSFWGIQFEADNILPEHKIKASDSSIAEGKCWRFDNFGFSIARNFSYMKRPVLFASKNSSNGFELRIKNDTETLFFVPRVPHRPLDFTQALRASMDPNGVGRVRWGTRYNLGPGVGKLNQSASRHQEFFPKNLPLKAISETAKWCLGLLATSKSTVVPASMNRLLHKGSLQLYKKNLNKIRQNNILYSINTHITYSCPRKFYENGHKHLQTYHWLHLQKKYCLTICVSFSDKSGPSSHSISYDFYG